jgi:MoxR-like ATPase
VSLAGKKVALTGNLPDVNRNDFRRMVGEAHAEYVANLDDAVDVLVVGDRPLASRVDKARRLGIQVVDRAGFDALLKQTASGADEDVPLAFQAVEDAPPSLEIRERLVRVLDLGVPRRHSPGALTPSVERFAHYTLDRPTLDMLRFVGRAVLLGQPCLLEGETATSKTSSILFLAALTNHEVVRINLNGQTDTSELVGRYVPNEDNVRLDIEALLGHLELLEDESRMILERAREQGRPLTSVEVHQIAANERIRPPQWRFQEGLVPQAMRKGWWVILDEVNLAEPPVLERLNSVLEREPTLVLTEGPGTRFGVGGDVPLHPDFRIFATMNPAEYQGRSVLSPAYKDRWVATWQADSPGELEYRQMLERVVYGRHPDVEIGGVRYRGERGLSAPYARLGDVAGLPGFLSKLAALHAGLVRMATPTEGKAASLGASRRERYVFSRRALLAVLDGLARLTMMHPATGAPIGFADAPEVIAADAIERAYLDRIRGDDDRGRVVALLRSLGLNRDGWLHRFAEEPVAEEEPVAK